MTDIDRVSKLVTPIAQKYGAKRVSLFGSRAKNTATETSDYDFVISRGNIQSLFQLASFIDELEKAFGQNVIYGFFERIYNNSVENDNANERYRCSSLWKSGLRDCVEYISDRHSEPLSGNRRNFERINQTHFTLSTQKYIF